MLVVDGQLHEPAITGEWDAADESTRWELMDELQLGLMRAVGVDRALLFAIEIAWALRAAERHPDRFAVVPMFGAGEAFGLLDATARDVEATVARLAQLPSIVAARIVHTVPDGTGGALRAPTDAFNTLAAACAALRLPVFMSTAGDLTAPAELSGRHPELTVIVDHLGLLQPPSYRPEDPPFRSLEQLLALAEHPNIAVKCSGAPTLSRQAYPFSDLWPHLHRVIDAFGIERVMWGSDFSRILGRIGLRRRIPGGETDYVGKHSYAEAVHYLRDTDELTLSEREWILGRTALQLLGWHTG